MVPGFNHNVAYQGAVFHVQTEDGGRRHPTIVTLLYHGGAILASRKISYADILQSDILEQAVEELMKEQHQGMLRSLKNGEFDEAIARYREHTLRTLPPAAPVPAKPPDSAAGVENRSAPPPGTDLEQLILAYLAGERR
jgi:hypothetical protein